MRDLRNKRAVSPVIATVILVAIAITVAVAVAYWIGGITGQYTQFEKIEVSTAYASGNATHWDVTLNLKNTGTTQASVTDVFVNAKSYADYGSGNIVVIAGGATLPATGYLVLSGATGKIVVSIDKTPSPASSYSWSSGTTIEVALHTGAGNTYMKMVTLP